MPAYNAATFIETSINSVLNQTFTSWELIIAIDNKSSDNTFEIAEKAAQRDDRIQVLSSPQCCSISANRNLCLERSKGQYITFLDADDLWLPHKLQNQINFMVQNSLVFSYHSYQVIDLNSLKTNYVRKASGSVGYKDLLKDNSIGCLTVMLKRTIFQNQKFIDIRHEDFHLWLQLLKGGHRAVAMPEVLAIYRKRKSSLSSNKFKSAAWRWSVYRKINLPYHISCYYMLRYFISAMSNRLSFFESKKDLQGRS